MCTPFRIPGAHSSRDLKDPATFGSRITKLIDFDVSRA